MGIHHLKAPKLLLPRAKRLRDFSDGFVEIFKVDLIARQL